MLYLFFQTWAWIIGAFILGLLCGWWICGRCNCKAKDSVEADLVAPVAPAAVKKTSSVDVKMAPEAPVKKALAKKTPAKKKKAAANVDDVVVDDAWKPKGFASKPKDADDLKKISGVGPVIEKTLNGLGIYQFKQIADFNKDNIAWVNKHISFVGRIEREKWVSQAKKLS